MMVVRTQKDVKKLGTILSVWAHPDDESFSAAGLMTTAIANGQRVVCVTATRGEAGVQDEQRWPAAQLAEIREEEMNMALKNLSITEHYFLGYQDGYCQDVPLTEGAKRISEFIERVHPDTILTFGPDGMTGHTDHQTISRWVAQATKDTDIVVFHAVEEEERYRHFMVAADKKFDIYFNIKKPPVFRKEQCDIAFTLPAAALQKKRNALWAMPSQTEQMFDSTPESTMNEMLAHEYFVLVADNNGG